MPQEIKINLEWKQDSDILKDMTLGIEEYGDLNAEINDLTGDSSDNVNSAFSPNNIGDIQAELSEFNKDISDLVGKLEENYTYKTKEVSDKILELDVEMKNLKTVISNYQTEDDAFHNQSDDSEDDEDEDDKEK